MYLLNGHYKVEILSYLLKKGNLNLMIKKKNHYHRTNTISSIRLISIKKKMLGTHPTPSKFTTRLSVTL